MNNSTRLALVAASILIAASVIYFSSNRKSRIGIATAQATAVKNTPFDWQAAVSDFAGAGTPGSSNGAAKLAQFSDPYGIAIDRNGNVYVADAGDNNQIRKIDSNGIVTAYAGKTEGYADGPVAEARFNTPSGLAIDADGNLYVADTGNNAIRKISKTGAVSTIAGNGTPGFADGAAQQAEFNGPIGVAVDDAGNVYVADTYNDRIRMIAPDGRVSTVAGSGVPGYADGVGTAARFDTPCAVALNSKGELIVADTKNNALRRIDRSGNVTTLYRTLQEEREAIFRRPVSLAITADDSIYIGTMKAGRVFQMANPESIRSLNDPEADLSVPRSLQMPYGLALTAKGELLATDAPAFKIRRLAPGSSAVAAPPPLPIQQVLWPVQPQRGPHEIVGTLGEDRGNDKGESRDHFHAGLDVRANMGSTVIAVAAGKVNDPLAAWGYGNLGEGLSIGAFNYIHIRAGRDQNGASLDPQRFIAINDDQNQPRIRVKRGTRFAAGDQLGTVNRMFHVHLEYMPFGEQVNPLNLGLQGYSDRIAPHIESIRLIDSQGRELVKKGKLPLQFDRHGGNLSIVVAAYDQADGNESRRRLGLYKLGYQILHKNGEPVPGYETPHMNIEFNQLPSDKAIKLAYAEGSGETVHGNKVTQFLYQVTNTVRDGGARQGFWNPADLASGEYLIRIYAADFAGNVALAGRDLAFKVL